MSRLLAATGLAFALVVVTASAKEYKNAQIMKMDDESITVKFEGSDKEVIVKVTDKTTFRFFPKNPEQDYKSAKEKYAKVVANIVEKVNRGMRVTITTEGDDKEDPAKDKPVVTKILQTGVRDKGPTKDMFRKDI